MKSFEILRNYFLVIWVPFSSFMTTQRQSGAKKYKDCQKNHNFQKLFWTTRWCQIGVFVGVGPSGFIWRVPLRFVFGSSTPCHRGDVRFDKKGWKSTIKILDSRKVSRKLGESLLLAWYLLCNKKSKWMRKRRLFLK